MKTQEIMMTSAMTKITSGVTVSDPTDPGPQVEFEKMCGTHLIVKKAQERIYKEPEPMSDSSDEQFQFNVTDSKAKRIKRRKDKE